MPIYEYKCLKCGHVFSELQKMSDPNPPCPAPRPPVKINVIGKVNPEEVPDPTPCLGETMKMMSRSSFHLKGTGWYATDYKD